MHLGEFSYLSDGLKRSHSSGRTWVTSETRSFTHFSSPLRTLSVLGALRD